MQSAICTVNQTTELTRESPIHPRPLRASGFVQPCAAANGYGCHGLCGRPPPPFRPPAQAAPASAVAELGVVRRLRTSHPSNERFRRHSESDAINQNPRFEDFQWRVYRESDGLAFGSFASISQPTFPEFAGERRSRVRQHLCPASIVGLTRPDAPRAAAPSVSTPRRFWAVLHCVRQTNPSFPDIHASASIASPSVTPGPSFRESVLKPTSPNHALQRTAPRVTVAAISSSDPSSPSHLFL